MARCEGFLRPSANLIQDESGKAQLTIMLSFMSCNAFKGISNPTTLFFTDPAMGIGHLFDPKTEDSWCHSRIWPFHYKYALE